MSTLKDRQFSGRSRRGNLAKQNIGAVDKAGSAVIVGSSASSLAAKFARGLTLRLERLRKVQDEISAHNPSTPSHGADGTHGRRLETRGQPRANRDGAHWLFVSTALALPTIRGQIQTVESISPFEQVAFDVTFAVGATLAPQLPMLDQIVAASDEEFSIVVESMLRSGAEFGLSSSERDDLLSGVSEFVRRALLTLPVRGGGVLEEFPRLLMPFSGSVLLPDSLGQFRRFVASAKRRYHDLLGPDLTSALLALTDPAMTISTRQLNAMLAVMRDWGLERTFFGLLLLRTLGPYPDERSFLSAHFGELASITATVAQRRMLAAMIQGAPKTKTVKPRAEEFTQRLVWVFHRLHSALASRQGRLLIDALVDLHCVDRSLIGFLDWSSILDVLRDHPPAGDARTAFVTFLMSKDAVRTRFPKVSFAMGKGALVSDLTSMIDPRRRASGLQSLLNQFRSLPERAAHDLTVVLVDRPMMERVASALPRPKNWPRELPPVDSTLVSMVRLDALRAAYERGLIPETTATTYSLQEVDHLRTQYFQRRMRSGRVRIPWEELERTVKELAEADLPALKIISTPPPGIDVGDLLPRLARFVADRITDHVLYESEVGIDQALSNNLRHGIVVPRFLRAFDDAFQTSAQSRSLPAWDENTLQQAFGSHGERLIHLRDFVAQTVKRFVDDSLTVIKGGNFDTTLRRTIAERVSGHMRGASTGARSDRLEKSVGAVLRRHIKSHLRIAGRSLTDRVQRAIMLELRTVRAQLRSSSSPITATFLDSLETNLHEAFGETKQWIGITQSHGDAIPFKLAEVVKIQLLSTSLSAWDKLHVKTQCVRQTTGANSVPSDFSITGKYLELFQEIVHNLLTNAFKYSGEQLKTKIELELFVQERIITIRCINSISELEIHNVIKNHPNTVAFAKATASDQARKDQVSGFQKIRRAFQGALGIQPHINIPPISANAKRFLVEITIDHPGDIVAGVD